MPDREDFTEATKRILAFKSGNFCAFEHCGKLLVVDETPAGDSAVMVGHASHIVAAAWQGPRITYVHTAGYRRSALNGIWLCSMHNTVIDAQDSQYGIRYLMELKQQHEDRVRNAILREMTNLAYPELEGVVSTLAALAPPGGTGNLALPVEIEAKIRFNDLEEGARQYIDAGMTQSDRVDRFVRHISTEDASYGRRLIAQFRLMYAEGLVKDLAGDELFEFVVASAIERSGAVGSDQKRAVAVAATVHVFELCKIFEVPDVVAR
jgi:hypothetical protein